jgi:hypothetical protein
VGDITYYAPWGNLAIFYGESTSDGLVKLGHLDAGVEKLARQRGQFTLRIEREGGALGAGGFTRNGWLRLLSMWKHAHYTRLCCKKQANKNL